MKGKIKVPRLPKEYMDAQRHLGYLIIRLGNIEPEPEELSAAREEFDRIAIKHGLRRPGELS